MRDSEVFNAGYMLTAVDADRRKDRLREIVELLGDVHFDAIAVRGMSGATMGSIVAHLMDKDLFLVRKEGERTHSSRRLEGPNGPCDYVIIDDLISSGETVKTIQQEIHTDFPEARCVAIALWHREAHFENGDIINFAKPDLRLPVGYIEGELPLSKMNRSTKPACFGFGDVITEDLVRSRGIVRCLQTTVKTMSAIETALRTVGAVLIRQKKHLVFRLPNGHNYVMGKTPSDNRAQMNAVKALNKVAALPPTKSQECV